VSALERVIYTINKIDAILAYDWITTPVREELTDMKSQLEIVKSDLGG
jgi:hypothetical protein